MNRTEQQTALELIVLGAMLASKDVRPEVKVFEIVPARIINEVLDRRSSSQVTAWLRGQGMKAQGAGMVDSLLAELERRRVEKVKERADIAARLAGAASVEEFCRDALEGKNGVAQAVAAVRNRESKPPGRALERKEPAGESPPAGRGVSGARGAANAPNESGQVGSQPVPRGTKKP